MTVSEAMVADFPADLGPVYAADDRYDPERFFQVMLQERDLDFDAVFLFLGIGPGSKKRACLDQFLAQSTVDRDRSERGEKMVGQADRSAFEPDPVARPQDEDGIIGLIGIELIESRGGNLT